MQPSSLVEYTLWKALTDSFYIHNQYMDDWTANQSDCGWGWGI